MKHKTPSYQSVSFFVNATKNFARMQSCLAMPEKQTCAWKCSKITPSSCICGWAKGSTAREVLVRDGIYCVAPRHCTTMLSRRTGGKNDCASELKAEKGNSYFISHGNVTLNPDNLQTRANDPFLARDVCAAAGKSVESVMIMRNCVESN